MRWKAFGGGGGHAVPGCSGVEGEEGMWWRARRACGGVSDGMWWRARVCKDEVEVMSRFVVEGEAYILGSGRHVVDGMRWRARACVVVEGANAKRKTHTQRDPEKKKNKCINVKKKSK